MNDTGQKLISYFFPLPTLQRIATIQVIANAWKMPEIQHAIRKHHLQSYLERHSTTGEFCEIKRTILSKLEQLLLPVNVKNELENLIGLIGRQLFHWMSSMKTHFPDFCDSTLISNFVCWTMNGTIDKRKTFESILTMKNEQNIEDLYKLACYYCLEDHVLDLSQCVPDHFSLDDLQQNVVYTLAAYWSRHVRMSDQVHCNLEKAQEMLQFSIEDGNPMAVKFFWFRLTNSLKNEIVVDCAQKTINQANLSNGGHFKGHYEFAEILCFFLSEMNDVELQLEIFEWDSESIPRLLFYNWPWREFFLPTVGASWDYIEENGYAFLVFYIVDDMEENIASKYMLRELWQAFPMHVKKYFICTDETSSIIMFRLCYLNDMYSIRYILKDASYEDRKTLVSKTIKHMNFTKMLMEGGLPTFDRILREMATSEEDLIRIKKNVVEMHGKELSHEFISMDKMHLVDHFLSWSFATEQECSHFKRNGLNKAYIFFSLAHQGKYELIEKFLCWIGYSEKILLFKKAFPSNSNGLISLAFDYSWQLFKNFADWSCAPHEQKDLFMCALLPYEKMYAVLSTTTHYRHSFQFVETFLAWCLESAEEVTRYKRRFMLSNEGIRLFKKFATCNRRDHLTFIIKVSQWCDRIIKDLINEFKRKLQRRTHRGLPSNHILQKSLEFLHKISPDDFKEIIGDDILQVARSDDMGDDDSGELSEHSDNESCLGPSDDEDLNLDEGNIDCCEEQNEMDIQN